MEVRVKIVDMGRVWVCILRVFVYYESRKRELKKRRKNEDRCDERLKTKAEESTCLACTGLHEELEPLRIKTRLIRVLSVVYYESRKREIKIRLMNEGRCDERLKARVEEFTCLTYTGLHDKTI